MTKTEHSLRGQSPGASVIEWEWKAKHLLTDVFVLRDFVLLMLCTGGAVTSLLMVMVLIFGDVDAMMRIAVFGLVMTGGVGLLFLLIMAVIGGRFRYGFRVDAQGVTFTMLSSFAKKANLLAIVLGALARSPGTVGAGLLARSEEYNRIDFSRLKTVRYYPRDSVIFLRGRGNPKPIRLYCPAEQYSQIAAAIEKGFAAGQRAWAAELARRGPSAVPGRLWASAAVVVAGAALFMSPMSIPMLNFGLLVATLVGVWIPATARFISVGLCCTVLGYAALTVQDVLTVRISTTEEELRAYAASQGVQLEGAIPNDILGNFAPYQTMHAAEWAGLAVAGLGAVALVCICVLRMRREQRRSATAKRYGGDD